MRHIIPFALIALCAPPLSAGLPEIDASDIEPEPTSPVTTQRWLTMGLHGLYPEKRDPYNFFDPQMSNFRDLLDRFASYAPPVVDKWIDRASS